MAVPTKAATNDRPGESATSAAFASALFPSALAERELSAVRARREALGLPFDEADTSGRVGLAISGGGIRSATFALGVLQSLAKLGRLRQVDYLSTVSGGGYIGSFLGSLYLPAGARHHEATRDATRDTTRHAAPSPADTVEHVERVLGDACSAPAAWLRENGRYIAPRGAGDYFYAAATFIRNWVALHYVLALTTLAVFLAGDLLRAGIWLHSEWMQGLEARLFARAAAGIWWSPYAVLPLAGFAIALVPLGWAYWLTQTRQGGGRLTKNPTLLATLLVFLAAASVLWWPQAWSHLPVLDMQIVVPAARYLALAAIISVVAWIIARVRAGSEGVARNLLSTWLTTALCIVLVLAAYALVDSLGQTLHAKWRAADRPGLWATLAALAPAIAALVQRFAPLIAKLGMQEKGLRLSSATILSLVGVLLLIALLVLWSAVGHAILWSGQCLSCTDTRPAPQLTLVATILAALLVIGYLTGRTIPFLNLSTLAQFYASRLTRAYLGATNPRRTGYRTDAPVRTQADATSPQRDVTRAHTADDMPWNRYRPDQHGGPLHLVNVTLNETVSGTSQLEQRDRKGMIMAVGPFGLSVGLNHHALWDGGDTQIKPLPLPTGRFAVFPGDHGGVRTVEGLTLGQWVAISGAAFTTGLGARTRLGLSTLLALSNVRLGYWWDSGISPRERANRVMPGVLDQAFELLSALLPVQSYLANETFARFHGPHRRRWYLSDGGHFENTAVYELLRRRVPFIIVCDDGQDDTYTFDDVGNLVRKARIDYDAEIRFLSAEEIEALLGRDSPLLGVIGTPAQLQRRVRQPAADAPLARLQNQAYSDRHATLAWVRYGDDAHPASLMLFLKPTLVGDEPLDLQDYFAEHPDFPQQSTLDQFFDEAQWESYRRLGAHIGERVFGTTAVYGRWSPGDMVAPSDEPSHSMLEHA